MRSKIQLLIVSTVVLAVLLVGCDDNGIGRSVVEVVAINEGQPYVDAQLNIGDPGNPTDDFIPIGHCKVMLRNRNNHSFINAPDETPYGQFIIKRVQIEWEQIVSDPASAQLPNFNRIYNYDAAIPKNETVEFKVMLVTQEMKAQSPLIDLLPPANNPPFVAQARVTFHGHDSGAPGDNYPVQCVIPVEFIGQIVEN